ncbi:NUDIX hydrolase [Nocardioides speluncae]|uniref:NUDIX hydrolase n=1 Tax=Nocardioides speluncae TaxID=2670337 RepID=UPI001F0B8CB7|nr:NUDIX domain-containing protein [Nocardioides speluncae]
MATETQEMVNLVDADGRVVGTESREVVRRDNLRHASTAVLVRNSAGEIFVHLRAATKDWAPSHHDCCAGGVIQAGEDPRESAVRELAEELGITSATLTALGTSLYEDDTTRCFEHVFETTWDGPLVYADHEVVSGEWLTLDRLAARLADPSWPFVPDSRKLLAGLAARGVHDYARLAG